MNNGIQKHVAELKVRAQALEEQSLGAMSFTSALGIVTQVRQNNCTIEEAWYGCGMETALKPEHKADTWDALLELFADTLTEMNCQHPWMNERMANRQMERLTEFDPSWTMEDFALFFDMLADGKLENHYGRPSREWLNKCQMAYNDMKYEALENIKKKARWKAENQQQEDMYQLQKMLGDDIPFMTDDETIEWAKQHRPRTMAEFLGGKSHLSATERAWLSQRDKERRDAKGA